MTHLEQAARELADAIRKRHKYANEWWTTGDRVRVFIGVQKDYDKALAANRAAERKQEAGSDE